MSVLDPIRVAAAKNPNLAISATHSGTNTIPPTLAPLNAKLSAPRPLALEPGCNHGVKRGSAGHCPTYSAHTSGAENLPRFHAPNQAGTPPAERSAPRRSLAMQSPPLVNLGRIRWMINALKRKCTVITNEIIATGQPGLLPGLAKKSKARKSLYPMRMQLSQMQPMPRTSPETETLPFSRSSQATAPCAVDPAGLRLPCTNRIPVQHQSDSTTHRIRTRSSLRFASPAIFDAAECKRAGLPEIDVTTDVSSRA